MSYTDFFIAPVPVEKRSEYRAFCEVSQAMMKNLGAVEIADFWGDDIPEGKVTSLPMAVKCGEGETVAAGWVVWPDKATRDAAWGRMMSEDSMGEMPFDGKRMIFGGFDEVLVTR